MTGGAGGYWTYNNSSVTLASASYAESTKSRPLSQKKLISAALVPGG